METTIIECAKRDAEDSTENRWTNALKAGVIVKEGDMISVEGIAINSIGVGGDIIEIPNTIQPPIPISPTNNGGVTDLKNDSYEPNEFQFNFGLYIHHNVEDTMMLPFYEQWHTGTATQIGQTLDLVQEEQPPMGDASPTYGYCKQGNSYRYNYKCNEVWSNNPSSPVNAGKRFYWVELVTEFVGTNGQISYIPAWKTQEVQATVVPSATPENYSWRMMTTDLRVKVDKGYDSPQNIATTINDQLNATWLNSAEDNTMAYTVENTALDIGGTTVTEVSVTKGSILSCPCNDNGLKTDGVGEDLGNWYYRANFYKNPNYICAGFNITAPSCEKGIIHSLVDVTKSTCTGDIIMIGNMPEAGGQTDIDDGQIMLTNMRWSSENLGYLKKLFYADGGANGGLMIDVNAGFNSSNASWDYVSEHPEVLYRNCSIGKMCDGVQVAGEGTPDTTLISNLITNASTYVPINGGDIEGGYFYEHNVSYTDERWESSILPLVPTGVACTITGYKKVEVFFSPFFQTNMFAREQARKYNMNVVCVFIETTDGIYDNYPFIGIPLREANSAVVPAPHFGDYCLFDPAFKRYGNECVKPIGWKTLYREDIPTGVAKTTDFYETAYQIGANNPTFSFNQSLGRFQFSQLDFPYYTGSGLETSAPPNSTNAIVKMNSESGYGFYYTGSATFPDKKKYSMLYARSGLGLVSFSLKTISGRWDRIEEYEDFSNEVTGSADIVCTPSDYWKNNLMFRLGWDYTDLFPKYGRPSNLYSNTTYGEYPQLVLYNPVQALPNSTYVIQRICELWNQSVKPFTTNAYFSTAMSTGFSVNNANMPMLDLHYQRGAGYGITASLPAEVIPVLPAAQDIDAISVDVNPAFLSATRLPHKLVYPYWLVYSDIIGNVKFLGVKGQPNNVMAVANRAYTSGDFAFNFATDYVFQATKDFVITQITTEIYNPDYTKSGVDEGTIILYKVQHPIGQQVPMMGAKTHKIK